MNPMLTVLYLEVSRAELDSRARMRRTTPLRARSARQTRRDRR